MKSYTKVYAEATGGALFPTKVSIRHVIADAPGFVQFIETVSGQVWTVPALIEELAHGKTLTLIGPTPTNRKYSGMIRSRKGKLIIQ